MREAMFRESRYNIWVEHAGAFYVYNGISGAVLCVPGEDYRNLNRFLSNQQQDNCSPALLTDLIRGRMLVTYDFDELKFLAERYRLGRFDTQAFSLTIVTSLGCNFSCPYCFEAKHPSLMKEEVEHSVLELLNEKLERIKQFNVCWFGGEPLLGKRSLFRLSDEFIARCERRAVNYNANILTNGYLLDKTTCAELRAHKVTDAQVTIDGPPKVHDRMRPLADGRGNFWHIVRNLRHAIDYLNVSIRVNVDRHNFSVAGELLQILADEGFTGKLKVALGRISGGENGGAPSKSYSKCSLTIPEYAQIEREFVDLAIRYGFAGVELPQPTAAPCTAVRSNELVVGSDGELYKCYQSVGNPAETIGNICNYRDLNGRLQKWLRYDPFANHECRKCIALPVCMGGCAQIAFDPIQYENRCDTFRYSHKQQVERFVQITERLGNTGLTSVRQLARASEPPIIPQAQTSGERGFVRPAHPAASDGRD